MLRLEDDFKNYTVKEHAKEYVLAWVEEYLRPSDDSCDVSELAWEITEDDNREGRIYVSNYDNMQFMCAYPLEAAEAYSVLTIEYCMTCNPFENPEQVVFEMYMLAIEEILAPVYDLSDNWGEITLNAETVEKIKEICKNA